VEAPEECDDGANNLQSANTYGPQGKCTSLCAKVKFFCGDGLLNGSEACDDKEKNTDTGYFPMLPAGITKPCSKACAFVPFCGDGSVSNGEQCDAGGRASTTCGADCKSRS
jgi:hypothetical protein